MVSNWEFKVGVSDGSPDVGHSHHPILGYANWAWFELHPDIWRAVCPAGSVVQFDHNLTFSTIYDYPVTRINQKLRMGTNDCLVHTEVAELTAATLNGPEKGTGDLYGQLWCNR